MCLVKCLAYHRQSQKNHMLAISFLYYNPNHSATRLYGAEGIKQKLQQLEQKTLYVQAELWNTLTLHDLTMKEGCGILISMSI